MHNDQCEEDEELRIIGSRVKRIDLQRRPHYPPVERIAIMELRAMRAWSKAEMARRFFVSADTNRAWLGGSDDDSLLQMATPVNRFIDFIRHAVQQIKLFCPSLAKVKIAEMLGRAGIHRVPNRKSTWKANGTTRSYRESTVSKIDVTCQAFALGKLRSGHAVSVCTTRLGENGLLHLCRADFQRSYRLLSCFC